MVTSLVKVPPMIQNICKNISSLIENRLLLHIYYQYISMQQNTEYCIFFLSLFFLFFRSISTFTLGTFILLKIPNCPRIYSRAFLCPGPSRARQSTSYSQLFHKCHYWGFRFPFRLDHWSLVGLIFRGQYYRG